MKKFLSDLNANTILQAVLSLLLWGTICYLYIKGEAVPDTLLTSGGLILGYYFHSSAQAALTAKAKVKNG